MNNQTCGSCAHFCWGICRLNAKEVELTYWCAEWKLR